jgi:hypothetical protein
MNRKVGLTIFFALVALLVSQSPLSAFLLEEAFTSLLVIAAVLLVIWLFLVTFVSVWHFVLFVLFLLRAISRRITGIRDDPVSSEKEMIHLPLRH